LADALKYIFKEIIIPASANKAVFILAPIVTMTLALGCLGCYSHE
jgi:NADH-quinone oxidoreductase subunit H